MKFFNSFEVRFLNDEKKLTKEIEPSTNNYTHEDTSGRSLITGLSTGALAGGSLGAYLGSKTPYPSAGTLFGAVTGAGIGAAAGFSMAVTYELWGIKALR